MPLRGAQKRGRFAMWLTHQETYGTGIIMYRNAIIISNDGEIQAAVFTELSR